MRKALGAAAILLASFFAALLYLREKRERIALISGFRESLLLLRREIAERHKTLPEIFTDFSTKIDNEKLSSFYSGLSRGMSDLGEKEFSVIWRSTVNTVFLQESETIPPLIASLGDSLGGSELDIQLSAIEETARALEDLARAEKEKLSGEKRMSIGLSLCFGAFAVIMLM